MIARAVLERLREQYGEATVLDALDRDLAGRMLSVGDNSAIVSVGDARFVVIHGDGSEELHDIKAGIR